MCLITAQKVKIAKKDFTVYKEFPVDSLVSPYHHLKYKLNILYQTGIKESNDWSGYDDDDLHFLYKNYPNWRGGEDKRLKAFGEGFHSILRKNRYECGNSVFQLRKCTIPAGSEYYLNGNGLCISNQIIVH